MRSDDNVVTAIVVATQAAAQYDSVYLNGKSVSCALLAAGGTVELSLAVARGELTNGVAVVRPPGHHAECGCAMGFCTHPPEPLQKEETRSRVGCAQASSTTWPWRRGPCWRRRRPRG